MEIPICDRRIWRRGIRPLLPALSGADGHPRHDDGAGCGPREQKKRSQGLCRTGETGLEVAYPWMVLRPGMLSAHDVLHDGIRLDACLFLEIRQWHLRLCESGRGRRGLRSDAGKSLGDGLFHGDDGHRRIPRLRTGAPERCRAHHEGHDALPSCAHRRACRA